jgi:rhamnogalacturonan endolyase
MAAAITSRRTLAVASVAVLTATTLGACTRPGTPGTTTTTGPNATTTTTQPGGPTTTVPGPGPDPERGRQVELLDRGVVSVRSGSGNLVSWRLFGTDPADLGFNVYRDGTKVNAAPVTTSTNLLDGGAPAGARYTVRAVAGGVEDAPSPASLNMAAGYTDVPLQVPGTGYTANDTSVGDVDGDGTYEYIVKWDPADSKDNSQAGATGNVYVDAYRQNGTRLWRIDLGRNIRAGAHYTQFQVYDLDGDGKAEVAMKTADGTRDGVGRVIGNASASYRNADGYVLSGPELLTVFNGLTGAAMTTTDYVPARGTVSAWGDDYGNRVDRFLAGVAYLDGKRPTLIMARGYYTRTVIVAWDWRNGALTRRWTFDSNVAGSRFAGQGNHNLSIADIDSDGRDEIIYGAMAVDDNGTGLWSTGMGHGDAQHVGDLVPGRPGLEVFGIQERTGGDAGSHLLDARTGATIWKKASASGQEGPGRGR